MSTEFTPGLSQKLDAVQCSPKIEVKDGRIVLSRPELDFVERFITV